MPGARPRRRRSKTRVRSAACRSLRSRAPSHQPTTVAVTPRTPTVTAATARPSRGPHDVGLTPWTGALSCDRAAERLAWPATVEQLPRLARTRRPSPPAGQDRSSRWLDAYVAADRVRLGLSGRHDRSGKLIGRGHRLDAARHARPCVRIRRPRWPRAIAGSPELPRRTVPGRDRRVARAGGIRSRPTRAGHDRPGLDLSGSCARAADGRAATRARFDRRSERPAYGPALGSADVPSEDARSTRPHRIGVGRRQPADGCPSVVATITAIASRGAARRGRRQPSWSPTELGRIARHASAAACARVGGDGLASEPSRQCGRSDRRVRSRLRSVDGEPRHAPASAAAARSLARCACGCSA